jgi:hypothetical protein
MYLIKEEKFSDEIIDSICELVYNEVFEAGDYATGI